MGPKRLRKSCRISKNRPKRQSMSRKQTVEMVCKFCMTVWQIRCRDRNLKISCPFVQIRIFIQRVIKIHRRIIESMIRGLINLSQMPQKRFNFVSIILVHR